MITQWITTINLIYKNPFVKHHQLIGQQTIEQLILQYRVTQKAVDSCDTTLNGLIIIPSETTNYYLCT